MSEQKFQPGEMVDITIRGARVIVAGKLLHLSYGGEHKTSVQLRSEAVTVTHTAPSEWPPQCGDVWQDQNGSKWFAVDLGDRIDMRGDSGSCFRPGFLLNAAGPLTLVYREGWTPNVHPLDAEVVEDDEPQAPDIVAALREIADLYEANPNMPRPRFCASMHYAAPAGVGDEALAQIHAAAEAMGIEVKSSVAAATGATHWSAERDFGAIELRVSYVQAAAKPEPTDDEIAEEIDRAFEAQESDELQDGTR